MVKPAEVQFIGLTVGRADITGRPMQASSQGFDELIPGTTGFSEANGHSRISAERPDYSSFAQQKRSSVELGMGNISHAANIYPGKPQAIALMHVPASEA